MVFSPAAGHGWWKFLPLAGRQLLLDAGMRRALLGLPAMRLLSLGTAILARAARGRRRRRPLPSFVDLSIRRCRGKLAAARFGVRLYFVEVVFCLTWLYRDPACRVPGPAIVFAVVTPIFLIGQARYRRKTLAELARLLELDGYDNA